MTNHFHPLPATLRGFTLIELMITVAIVAILASVAYPAYTEQVARSRRADAQAVLMEAAQHMQRFYAAHNRYDLQLDGATANALPGTLQASPRAGTAAYTLSISAVDAGAFTLTATATGAQANDRCGNFTLTHTGARGVTGSGATVQDCWR
ncbi:prepilin-type N-terminal cleavage/methylation domain-containing protein [Aquabacterium fontiphilum]|uniref:type IV pilin protein n=1 Tax=Aquabacterium fontiphilum TaxID=450365 RepID=UPI001377BF47|nr:prepilin-type N-terminal cleavage/methylation domain-containing protein [Aquabacterium fontiphilum]